MIKFIKESLLSIRRSQVKAAALVFALYISFLIINLPASLVISNIDLPREVRTSSVSGTLWSGKINDVSVSGISLGEMSWELHPLALLIGHVSTDVSFHRQSEFITSAVVLSLSGSVELEETRFNLDISSLRPLTYGLPVTYLGQASGYFPSVYFLKNEHVGINGKLTITGLEITSPQQQNFGDFSVVLKAENEGLTSGKVKVINSPLNVNGDLTLSKTGHFNSTIKAGAKEKGSALDQMLSFFGRKDAEGRVVLITNLKLW
ncbi:MAG: type II secretion system protein N [Woeseiaceae bacterium]